MKILVLGNINSKWVKEFIEYILLPLGHKVEVLGDIDKCRFRNFYQSSGIDIHIDRKPSIFVKKIPFLRVLNSVSRTIKHNQWDKYDFIINMFVNHRNLRITRKVASLSTKTIVYYTGSDLLRKSKFHIFLNRHIIPKPSAIVVGSKTLDTILKQKYPETTKDQIISFGVSAFDNIDRFKKEHHNTRTNNTFCIGYSGVRQHNHLKIIDVFDKLSPELKKITHLIVPMTYMADKEYIAEVRNKLDDVGISYTLPTEYMDNDSIAQMWCGISYFINAQSTDSLSASVLEALYSGATLINASWLDYPEYKEFGVKYLSFDDYDKLFEIITSILENKINLSNFDISEILHIHFSWYSVKEAWKELFSQLENY